MLRRFSLDRRTKLSLAINMFLRYFMYLIDRLVPLWWIHWICVATLLSNYWASDKHCPISGSRLHCANARYSDEADNLFCLRDMQKLPKGSTNSPETLWQVIWEFLQFQIGLFLMIWLSLVVPVTCQHGMMSLINLSIHHSYDAEPGHSGHNSAKRRSNTQTYSGNLDHDSEVSCHIRSSESIPRDTLLLSLLIGILPIRDTLYALPTLSGLIIFWASKPRQVVLPPPEQPPRLLPILSF